MGQIIRLVKIGFDSLENRNPQYKETIGLFVDGDGLTALGKVSKWFDEQPPVKLYQGYDGGIYPQFELVYETVL